jgi:uncharacterized iron-regulated membrane protein
MAAVAGSAFRRTLFWAHLIAGVLAGVIILLASVTGVLLAYERQLVDVAASGNRITHLTAATPLPADRLAGLARAAAPDARRLSLVIPADPELPVSASRGGEGAPVLINPYTGETVADAAAGTRQFLRTMEDFHRWLGGRPGGFGSVLVDLATLLFLFITMSGLYLWLPPVWRWLIFKARWRPRAKYPSTRARDYGWHIAFSFWALIPLFVIGLSGVVMSYDWANQLVYAAYGEQPPQRRGPPEGGPGGPGGNGRGPRAAPQGAAETAATPASRASLEALVAAAAAHASPWQRLTVPLGPRGETIDIVAELQSTERRAPRQVITLNSADASLVKVTGPANPQATQSPGQRARTWFRFAHTGEQYGLVGQTIAALASLVACLLAYTGIALAWRRLVVPLWRH